MCLFVYLGNRAINAQQIQKPPVPKKQGIKAKLGPVIFALPAAIDLCGSTLMMIGLRICLSDAQRVSRGSCRPVQRSLPQADIISTLLRRSSLRDRGVLIVGLGSVFIGETSSNASNPALGAILIVLAQFVEGWVFIIEEKFFGDIKVSPL